MEDLTKLIEELDAASSQDAYTNALFERAAEALRSYAPDNSKVPVQEILDLYNTILGSHLQKAMRLPHARKQAICSRWRESKEQRSLEWWKIYFTRVADSDFLCGRTENRFRSPWKANIDWLLRPTPMAKVMEGNYDSRTVSLAASDRRMLGYGA